MTKSIRIEQTYNISKFTRGERLSKKNYKNSKEVMGNSLVKKQESIESHEYVIPDSDVLINNDKSDNEKETVIENSDHDSLLGKTNYINENSEGSVISYAQMIDTGFNNNKISKTFKTDQNSDEIVSNDKADNGNQTFIEISYNDLLLEKINYLNGNSESPVISYAQALEDTVFTNETIKFVKTESKFLSLDSIYQNIIMDFNSQEFNIIKIEKFKNNIVTFFRTINAANEYEVKMANMMRLLINIKTANKTRSTIKMIRVNISNYNYMNYMDKCIINPLRMTFTQKFL